MHISVDCTVEINICEGDNNTTRPQQISWLNIDSYETKVREQTGKYTARGYQSCQQISVQQGNIYTVLEVVWKIENNMCTTLSCSLTQTQ